MLAIPAGSPVLVWERITSDEAGQAVLVADCTFGAHKPIFTVEVANPAPSIGPSGLRLLVGRVGDE